MTMKLCLLSGAILVLVWSCKPSPFSTELAGYAIRFPTTLAELQKEYPKGYLMGDDRFIDSSQAVKVEWWFNIWGGGGNRGSRNQPHGVVMFLRNKDTQFDSVKTALAQRYKQTLKPLVFTRSNGDFSKLKPIYVCHINQDVFLVLTKSDSYRSEPNSLRIAIGYKLSKKQEEAFALLGGDIYNDKL